MQSRPASRRALIFMLGAIGVGACAPAAVPEGYVFPTWRVGGAGAAALMEGKLVADRGCLYVQPTQGGRYLVVWPDTLQLVLDPDGTAVVMSGSTPVARVGEDVRLGGGEIGPDLTPRDAAKACGGMAWGANEIIPAETQ